MNFHLNHVGYKGKYYNTNDLREANFHLNHVGYKVISGFCPLTSPSVFHLNHVGYKAGWDGNFSNRICHFHLNHVGYKVIVTTTLQLTSFSSFI